MRLVVLLFVIPFITHLAEAQHSYYSKLAVAPKSFSVLSDEPTVFLGHWEFEDEVILKNGTEISLNKNSALILFPKAFQGPPVRMLAEKSPGDGHGDLHVTISNSSKTIMVGSLEDGKLILTASTGRKTICSYLEDPAPLLSCQLKFEAYGETVISFLRRTSLLTHDYERLAPQFSKRKNYKPDLEDQSFRAVQWFPVERCKLQKKGGYSCKGILATHDYWIIHDFGSRTHGFLVHEADRKFFLSAPVYFSGQTLKTIWKNEAALPSWIQGTTWACKWLENPSDHMICLMKNETATTQDSQILFLRAKFPRLTEGSTVFDHLGNK